MRISVEMVQYGFARNQYGIAVRKACCSCLFKTIEKDGSRTCRLMTLKVEQRFRCPNWKMSDGLMNAGRIDH